MFDLGTHIMFSFYNFIIFCFLNFGFRIYRSVYMVFRESSILLKLKVV